MNTPSFSHLVQEPVLRIGIILARDGKRQCHIFFPAEGEIADSRLLHRVPPDSSICVDSRGSVSISGIPHEVPVIWPVRLRVPGVSPGERGKELRVHGVIAGRDFHWRGEMDQSLPGILAITRRGEYLELVNEVGLETYLACVATSEMSAHCPAALLEAQTIAARSWILAGTENKHPGLNACNDDCCQRYQGSEGITVHSEQASQTTRGMVLMSGEMFCDARYSKSCGGFTESFANVWPGPTPAYLQGVIDAPLSYNTSLFPADGEEKATAWIERAASVELPVFCSSDSVPENDLPRYLGRVDLAGTYFRWQVRYARDELEELLRQKANLPDLHTLSALSPGSRGASGRLRSLVIEYTDQEGVPRRVPIDSQYEIRRVLHPSFLYSSAFVIRPTYGLHGQLETLEFRGAGWGHGVGLCQIGALGMALQGYSTQEILQHYFRGARLVKLYD